MLFKEGISALKEDEIIGEVENVKVSERTVYDNLVEDIRRSLRFYAKQTGQSFFLKIFLSGGSGATPGLKEFINEKLNIESDFSSKSAKEKIEKVGGSIKVKITKD